jgi:hypothetical protein
MQSYSVSSVSEFGSDYSFAGTSASGITLPSDWKNVIYTGFSLGGAIATLAGILTDEVCWDGSVSKPKVHNGGDIPGVPTFSFGNPPVFYDDIREISYGGKNIQTYQMQWRGAVDIARLAFVGFKHVGNPHHWNAPWSSSDVYDFVKQQLDPFVSQLGLLERKLFWAALRTAFDLAESNLLVELDKVLRDFGITQLPMDLAVGT